MNELIIGDTPTETELYEVQKWLSKEYNETGESFIVNWSIILSAHEDGRMMTVGCDGENFGFLTYFQCDETVEILIFSIRPDKRRTGIGSKFFSFAKEYFSSKELIAVTVQCNPATSIPFWIDQNFIELPVIYDSPGNRMYCPLEVHLPPNSSSSDFYLSIQLWDCEPHQTDQAQPRWSWNFNKVIEKRGSSILMPANRHWNIRIIKEGQTLHNGKIKWISSGTDLDQGEFLYISDPFILADSLCEQLLG